MDPDDSPILPGLPDYTERVKKTTAELTLKFDGGVTKDNVIPLDLYAPSILALGTSLSVAHQVLQPGTPAPDINIRAEEPGSFDALLTVDVNTILEQGAAVLTGKPATAVLNAIALFGVVRTAIAVVKKIAGRRYTKSEPSPDGEVTLSLAGGDSLTVTGEALRLIEDPKFRKNLRKLFIPLKGEKIETMSLSGHEPNGREIPPVEADQSDSDSFDYDDDDEPDEWADDVELTVVSPDFRRGRAWKFDSSFGEFSAKILDDDFLDRVEKEGIKFGVGDTIMAVVVTTQYVDKLDQVKTKRVVSKVLDVLPPVQGQLAYGN